MATQLQQLIADYIQGKADRGEKESYSSIARRGGMERGTVQALATRNYTERGPSRATIEKLARGLEMDVRRVRDAVALSVGHGPARQAHPNPDVQLLVDVVAGLDDEKLQAVLRRARMLRAEQDEERAQRRDRDR